MQFDAGNAKQRLQAMCSCSSKAKKAKPSCLAPFLISPLWEKYAAFKTYWGKLHKLDQDRALFDIVRDMAVSQKLVPTAAAFNFATSCNQGEPVRSSGGQSVDADSRRPMKFVFLDRPVCQDAFLRLMGIGKNPRFSTIAKAVMSGARSCPVDVRYLRTEKQNQKEDNKSKINAALRGEVYSHLLCLYESVAETMPDADDDGAADVESDLECDALDLIAQVAQDSGGYQGGSSMSLSVKKHLPPGSVFDTWRQYRATNGTAGYIVFKKVWEQDFGKCLVFRDKHMHKTCSVCTQHKLLIAQFGADCRARFLQRQMFDRHLAQQYRDRQCYWALRAESRLGASCGAICLIIDAMDQAKFSWPRAPFVYKNPHFEHRPRLHCYAVIVHGFAFHLYLTQPDVCSGGSCTVELLSHALGTLHSMQVDLASRHLHIQMDNCGSQNKNNSVLLWLSCLTYYGMVRSTTAAFLRTGHTHEEPTQPLSMLFHF
jgi:hypothetical protein